MERNIYKIGKKLFITSDEEIKEGDWFLDDNNQISHSYRLSHVKFANPKKIILTTDQDLITDGVQAIDDEFLEWFVKNPSCEFVEVESKVIKDGVWTDLKGYVELPTIHSIIHKIIIPKEEHCICEVGHPYNNATCKIHGGSRKEKYKQELPQLGTKEFNDLASAYFGGKPKQETLEEAKDTAWNIYEHVEGHLYSTSFKNGFEAGAKWQKEQDKDKCSKDEVIAFVQWMYDYKGDINKVEELLEQFKKK